MRIDKYLANLGLISRKDCKKVIKSENIFKWTNSFKRGSKNKILRQNKVLWWRNRI